jgi:hypothetical protein
MISDEEKELEKLKKMTQEQYEALSPTDQGRVNSRLRELESRRENDKKKLAEANDVIDSMTKIAKLLPDVDLTNAPAFAEALLDNCITKWELRVATAEIIRSRTKFTAVAEYFLAINRLKARLATSNHSIYHDNALDF